MKNYLKENGFLNIFTTALQKYDKFYSSIELNDGFKFSQRLGINPYSNTFGILGKNLIHGDSIFTSKRDHYRDIVIKGFSFLESKKIANDQKIYSKPYMQLLSFSLSSLAVLNALEDEKVIQVVESIKIEKPSIFLSKINALNGQPQSGNLAMLYAIVLLYRKIVLKDLSINPFIDEWVKLHLNAMNSFGFWGSSKRFDFLQFQNGYHQYEILDFLNITHPNMTNIEDAVLSLADSKGHFAPYAGGGGCYDFDAIYMLCRSTSKPSPRLKAALMKTYNQLLSEQQGDGGFCENLYLRKKKLSFATYFFERTMSLFMKDPSLGFSSLKQLVNLQRPKHKFMRTHWSEIHRKWDESNAWDTWFRMFTIAKITIKLDLVPKERWHGVPFPGIGFIKGN